MAEGKCATCSRYLLIVFNFLFWICGGVCIGIGLWAVLDPDIESYLRQLANINIPLDSIMVAAYILIAVGSFMFFVGFCGCCGAIRESACMLGVYIACMAVVICGELSAGIYVAVEKGNLEGLLRKQLLGEVKNYTKLSNRTTISLDFLQARFECCGADSFKDYLSNPYFYNSTKNISVPDSCCRDKGTKVTPPEPINSTACQIEARLQLNNTIELRTKGCFPILTNWLDANSAILIGVVVGIAVIEILGLIFAVCLCRNRTIYYD
ncbi:hypothetical protein ACJMK2_020456 [Sinanodonta woodiana]|uniref:Tetraspanin n=1 Tax=Sinanodonta woodiana TaxID=1069815 RepID=A0ABD3U1W3_SINWO